MILIINNNDNSFSARPEEFISLYDEFILADELQAVNHRVLSIVEKLRKIKTYHKNEPIKENNQIFYIEFQKQASRNFANYFLDIEVIF